MKVFCAIYNKSSNCLMTMYEEKSGLRGVPKERIWPDENHLSAEEKLKKILLQLGFEDSMEVLKKAHAGKDVVFILGGEFKSILEVNKAYKMCWDSLDKKFEKYEYNSSVNLVIKAMRVM